MALRSAVLLFITVLATADAEQMRGVLTNASIVTLASAGFHEQFIVDTIAASRTDFDTSVKAIVELEKLGISEGVIRAMTTAGARSPASPSDAASQCAPAKPAMPRKAKSIVLAIAARAPYSESKAVLWGLYKKRVGVGAGAAGEGANAFATHLGAMYESVHAGDGAHGR